MFMTELYIFSFIVLFSALLSVCVKHTLYAVFCQIQAVAAVAGILSCLNAGFVGFSLLLVSCSALLVFLLFALVVFDFYQDQRIIPKKTSIFVSMLFCLIGAEAVYFFIRPKWHKEFALPDFSLEVLGKTLYVDYGLCVILFSVLLLSCFIGITTLLVRKNVTIFQEQEESL